MISSKNEVKRLELIATLAKKSKILVDFGCDHGYVLKDCFLKYNLKKGIAIDNKKGPLEYARKNLAGFDVDFLLTNSFKNLNIKFDTCVIAGLGSKVICEILQDAPLNKKYILSANKNNNLLRKFLEENKFKIINERIAYENDKFYEIIVCLKKNKKYIMKNYYLSKYLKRDFLFLDYQVYLKKQIEKIENEAGKINKEYILEMIEAFSLKS